MKVKELFNKPARNFVAKNMPKSGSGRHTEKRGKNTSRQRQNTQWKKESGV